MAGNVHNMTLANSWIIDSGATDHICTSLHHFISYKRITPIYINLPNSSTVSAHYTGTVAFHTNFHLLDVLYVPQFSFNLLSVSKIVNSHHFDLTFSSSGCMIQDVKTKEKIGLVKVHVGLYVLTPAAFTSSHSLCNTTPTTLWHSSLGHPSNERLCLLHKKYSYIVAKNPDTCDVCHRSKQRKLLFPLSTYRTLKPFDLMHIDIWGPCSTSINGFKYFLTIVDGCTRYTWLIHIIAKSETRKHVSDFVTYIHTQFQTIIKVIRTDNGSEFLMHAFYTKYGIIHQTSCTYTPEQNGIVERKHQHILNVTRALLFQAHLPHNFWCFAAQHVVLLINCIPTPLLKNDTPYKRLYGSLYDLSLLRIFGCLCYISTHSVKRTKLDSRAISGIFLGLKPHTKGYLFLNLNTHQIDISRHVIFHENTFPYSVITHNSPDHNSLSLPTPAHYMHDFTVLDQTTRTHVDDTPHCPSTTPTTDNASVLPDIVPPFATAPNSTTITDPPRRSNRQRNVPSYLNDFLTHTTVRYPITQYLNYSQLSPSFKHIILFISSTNTPHSYTHASKDPRWVQAIQDELQALADNNTRVLTDLPPGKTVIGCRWVYKVKHHSDGSIKRFKARLVAKGYNQFEGLNFLDTFAPVAKLTTLRLLLALATSQHWII